MKQGAVFLLGLMAGFAAAIGAAFVVEEIEKSIAEADTAARSVW